MPKVKISGFDALSCFLLSHEHDTAFEEAAQRFENLLEGSHPPATTLLFLLWHTRKWFSREASLRVSSSQYLWNTVFSRLHNNFDVQHYTGSFPLKRKAFTSGY